MNATAAAVYALHEVINDRAGHGLYIIPIVRALPCGHESVSWYGWKQNGQGTLSLALSLESHEELRCSICGVVIWARTPTVDPVRTQTGVHSAKTHSIPEGNGVGGYALKGTQSSEGYAVEGTQSGAYAGVDRTDTFALTNTCGPEPLGSPEFAAKVREAMCRCGFRQAAAGALTHVFFVPIRPLSQNDAAHLKGTHGSYAYRKERAKWVAAFRGVLWRGEVTEAKGPRRVVLTRVYSGREQERDYGNLVGGMKLVLDAMRPSRSSTITSGKRKGVPIVTEGAGLILDDTPALLDDVYLQERSSTKQSGLRVEITDLGAT